MPEQGSKLIYEDLSFQINGILFKVHNKLGLLANFTREGVKIKRVVNILQAPSSV